MINHHSQFSLEYFVALKSKYQATDYENSSLSSLLYLILRKADLGMDINDIEWNWLLDNQLLETITTIKKEQEDKAQAIRQLDREFDQLRVKYNVTHRMNKNYSPVYSILWKLDSEHEITDSEIDFLIKNSLKYVADQSLQITEFKQLRIKYKADQFDGYLPDDSLLYSILKKLESEADLNEKDVEFIQQQKLLEISAIVDQKQAIKQAEFAQLKEKYKATIYLDLSVFSPLYQILKTLDSNQKLSSYDIKWLEDNKLNETLSIVLEIEQKEQFNELKIKYKATSCQDSLLSSHLYKLLKKIDANIKIVDQDINFLKNRKLMDTIAIAIEKYADHLKSTITIGDELSQPNIDWLQQNGREDIIVFAIEKYADHLKSTIKKGEELSQADIDWLQQNGRENIIVFAKEKHFATLKSKYDVSSHQDQGVSSGLYPILQKLEKGNRLEEIEVAWLIEKNLFYHSYYGNNSFYNISNRTDSNKRSKIFIAYHKIEATFYEQEYQQTGNQWKLPNASSHWRKAKQPQRALKLTENINFSAIKENKLKSALLTTRGGAFRDVDKLDQAETCARKAIEYQPNSHHPYTLMGAICFERGEFLVGEHWFEEAIKRGASPKDQDAEMKQIVKNAKDENKRRTVVEYLLKKDPHRYSWAKSYLKSNKNLGK
jgi:phosphotransferase system IIA component